MKTKTFRLSTIFIILLISIFVANLAYTADEQTRKILGQALIGAGSGAIAAEASGGKAGTGALIGAGTSVIGSALLDAITTPSASQGRRAAPQQQDEYYYTDEPEEYYELPPQESSSTKILKQGLIGAGTGALAAGASGGKAGQGALIGAGTSVVGTALLDTLTQPSEQKKGKVYRRVPRQKVQEEEASGAEGGRKKIIRKYDESGKVVSEEEVYY